MDPEMMRVAQEQMSWMSPADLAAMQQQLMSNPSLLRFASESLGNLSAGDISRAARQLNQTRPEEMVDMAKKLSTSNPEELAAMKAQAEPRISYAVSSARTLKNQGNQLHKLERYGEAAAKYSLAKDSLKNVPSQDAQSLQKVCTVNLMACYLKIGKFGECVDEGSEVLGYDPSNVKAYYRRGQAYKELGNLEASVADLSKAHELSPDDEIISEVLRDAEEKLALEREAREQHTRGVVIEEIVEEEEGGSELSSSETSSSSTPGCSVPQPSPTEEASPSSSSAGEQEATTNSMIDPAFRGLFASILETMDPEVMSTISRQFGMNLPKDDAVRIQRAVSSFSPENLDRVMRCINRARQAVDAARNAKEFLLGRKGLVVLFDMKKGLVLAIVVLILTFILRRLGFIDRFVHGRNA